MGTRAHRSPSRHPRQRHVPPQQKRHFRRDESEVGACLEVYYRTDRPRTLFMTLGIIIGVGVRGEWGAPRARRDGKARKETRRDREKR